MTVKLAPRERTIKPKALALGFRNKALQTSWSLQALHHHEAFADEHSLKAFGLTL
jgi:hypothetical protein